MMAPGLRRGAFRIVTILMLACTLAALALGTQGWSRFVRAGAGLADYSGMLICFHTIPELEKQYRWDVERLNGTARMSPDPEPIDINRRSLREGAAPYAAEYSRALGEFGAALILLLPALTFAFASLIVWTRRGFLVVDEAGDRSAGRSKRGGGRLLVLIASVYGLVVTINAAATHLRLLQENEYLVRARADRDCNNYRSDYEWVEFTKLMMKAEDVPITSETADFYRPLEREHQRNTEQDDQWVANATARLVAAQRDMRNALLLFVPVLLLGLFHLLAWASSGFKPSIPPGVEDGDAEALP